jgi:hypothetical protein
MDLEIAMSKRWHKNSAGYVVSGKIVLLHRLILTAPIGTFVDHRNHDPLDNRRSNLRICSHAKNLANQNVQTRTKSSQFKGVSWAKHVNKWRSLIQVNGVSFHLGLFSDETQAAQAYNQAAIHHFGEFAKPNVLPP